MKLLAMILTIFFSFSISAQTFRSAGQSGLETSDRPSQSTFGPNAFPNGTTNFGPTGPVGTVNNPITGEQIDTERGLGLDDPNTAPDMNYEFRQAEEADE